MLTKFYSEHFKENTLGKPRCRSEGDTKMDLQAVWMWAKFNWLEIESNSPMAGFCERCTEPCDLYKSGKMC